VTPPILLLVIDCLRADRAWGQANLNPQGFIGRLIRSGLSFTQAVTVTPTTTPAVASMLTGCYPFEHGLRGLAGYTRPASIPTAARALRELGYRTEADVTGPLQPELQLFTEFDDYRYVEGRSATIHGTRGADLAHRVKELQDAGSPWFLLFHVWDLHEPRQVPAGRSGPALSRTVYDRALGAVDDRLATLLPADLLEGCVVCLVGDHGENLRFEPRGKLGRIVAGLLWWKPSRRFVQPLATRWIARGAQSESKRLLRVAPRALLTHGHHLFEPLLRVPYVVSGPGVPHGSTEALVTHVDLAPTLVQLAGGWLSGGAWARPLPLDGSCGDPDRQVYVETAWVTSLPGVRQVGVRTPRWKYFEVEGGSAPALFDLRSDPHERRNVVREEVSVATALGSDLRAAYSDARTGDTMSAEDEAAVTKRLADLGYLG
jgi:arylsulfatase A-like enzyme